MLDPLVKVLGNESKEDNSSNMAGTITITRQIVEEFFGPMKAYQRLAPHTVEESPCYPIIIVKDEGSYLCKLHCSQDIGVPT